MNIIFFGSGKYVIPIIEVLKQNFDLKLVVTTEKETSDPVVKYSKANNIEYISTNKLDQTLSSKLLTLNCPIAVLASFGLIIPQSFLDLFPKGIINIHPSLLPKYRGTTPVQTAILNGDHKTGVSVMLLDRDMDHGPILGQKEEPILDTDTSDTLYTRLFTIGSQMLINIISTYLTDELIPEPQNHTDATYTKPLNRESGYINLDAKFSSKLQIASMVRAYFPWPGVWTTHRIKNQELRIKFLPNEKIQIEGKKPVSIKDFINGYSWGKDLVENLQLS